MKLKERGIAILLSLVMVLTFMPTMAFATDGDSETYVTKIEFKPVGDADRSVFEQYADSYSAWDYDDDGTEYGPYERYDYELQTGDTIVATYSDGTTETLSYHLADEDDVEVGNWSVKGSGADPKYDSPDFEDDQGYDASTDSINEWGVGEHAFTLVYGSDADGNDVSTPINVRVIENRFSDVQYAPAKSKYTQAQALELEYEMTDEDKSVFVYNLYPRNGDKLIVTEKEKTTTYTFDDDEYEYFSEDGSVIDWDLLRIPRFVSETRLPVDGSHDFSGSYNGVKFTVPIEFEESSEEEIALEDARRTAYSIITDIEDSINYSDYRAAQQNQLEEAFEKAYYAVGVAKNIPEMDSAVAALKQMIAAVKTDAQLRQEATVAQAAQATTAEAAAEAAFQGTPDSSVPAVKKAKVKAGKKSFSVSWKKASKKQLKKFDKVEVQYSTNKNFPRTETKVKEVKKSKKSLKVKGLAKKSTYYVRVRDIKYVNGVKHVGKWAKAKKVKIK